MIRRPPRSTRTDTLFPYTTLFRSAEVQKPGARLAVTDDFEHSLLGQTRGAARFVLVGHRTRANDSSSTKRPGLGGVSDQLRKIELHVLAGLGRAAPGAVDVAVQRSEERRVGKVVGSTGRSRWAPDH